MSTRTATSSLLAPFAGILALLLASGCTAEDDRSPVAPGAPSAVPTGSIAAGDAGSPQDASPDAQDATPPVQGCKDDPAPEDAGTKVTSPLQMNVSFRFVSIAPTGPLKASTGYDITAEMNIHASRDVKLELVPTVAAGWTAAPADTSLIEVPVSSATQGFVVSRVIHVTSGSAGSASLVLNLRELTHPENQESSQPTVLSIGAAPEVPTDTRIDFINVQGIGPSAFQDDTLFVPRKAPPGGSFPPFTLSALAILDEPGTYTMSQVETTPAGEWSVVSSGSSQVTTNVAGASYPFSVKLKPKNDGCVHTAADGQLSFVVSNGAGISRTFRAKLRVVDALPPL